MEPITVKRNIEIVSGKFCCGDCKTCSYAVLNHEHPKFTNCTLVNGSQNHRELQSKHGLVIKPRKNGTCDYYGKGQPCYIT